MHPQGGSDEPDQWLGVENVRDGETARGCEYRDLHRTDAAVRRLVLLSRKRCTPGLNFRNCAHQYAPLSLKQRHRAYYSQVVDCGARVATAFQRADREIAFET